jgi:hypothetical protein
MLPAEIFEMRKPLLTLSLAKPRYNAEAALKNEMFIYGVVHSITDSLCKKCAENSDNLAYAVVAFLNIFSYCY